MQTLTRQVTCDWLAHLLAVLNIVQWFASSTMLIRRFFSPMRSLSTPAAGIGARIKQSLHLLGIFQLRLWNFWVRVLKVFTNAVACIVNMRHRRRQG